tara:strand:- start:52 stop:372 length:321 start_codon:yes stop_codon:yes gene_type:complete
MKKRLTREEYHKGLIGKVSKKWHKEMLEEFDRDEELNTVNEPEQIHKTLHEINTFQCVDNELYLRGKDEYGKDFTLCFDAFNFLEWIDKDQIEYIKQKTIEYIESK